jgi:hypothetical protein
MPLRPALPLLLLVALLALVTAVAPSCQTYIAPPVATIEGLDNGVLSDPSAPLVIQFSKPIDPSTLKLQVIKFDPNADGQLPDETGDASVSLDPLYAHDPIAVDAGGKGDTGGTGTLDSSHTIFTIKPLARLPVGPKLAVLIEPGLWDAAHDSTAQTAVRKRLLFGYAFNCTGTGTKLVTSGPYFFLLDVQEPIGTQIKVFADLQVDAATGRFVGQFTFASRKTDPTRCSPACTMGDVCQTIPGPSMCVVPSTRAGGPDEWPDFYANSTPPVGFSFTVNGCAEDEPDGTATLGTEPANMVVQSPAVSVDGLVLLTSFSQSGGNLVATGTVTGDNIVFGTSNLGSGHGDVEAQSIPPAQAPPIPAPPADAGSAAVPPTGDL